MSNVQNALAAHNQAANDRNQVATRMGAVWNDAASRVVEARYLEPLATEDRSFAAALADLGHQLDRAARVLHER